MNDIIEEIIPPENNFNTCKFRSKEPRVLTIKRCSCQGGDYTEESHYCDERQIQKLTPDICERCILYQKQ